jgi:dethiobiotin synthetase
VIAHSSFFVAGTDTGVGKTLVSAALVHAFVQQGRKTAGMKPVASGAEWRDGAWHNEDVDALRAASNVELAMDLINPYLMQAPTAPHIAAAAEGKRIELDRIRACFHAVSDAADVVIVEGVGGFIVPLNEDIDTADLAQELGLPVVLVVGIRLGCISHALLTAQAIAARGLPLAGWVANIIDPAMLNLAETIAALKTRLPAPVLGCIPHMATSSVETAAACLDISLLTPQSNNN